MINRQEYYEMSVMHRNSHKCGGYPFENGEFLTQIAKELQANQILEIGTAIGYSAYSFALANDMVQVDSIDMISEHKQIAEDNWNQCNLQERVRCLFGKSTEVVSELDKKNVKYDIIFFDGFSPIPEEIDNYISLLNAQGLLITTNLELASEIDRVDEYLEILSTTNLITYNSGDTAFSSQDLDVLEKCKLLWT